MKHFSLTFALLAAGCVEMDDPDLELDSIEEEIGFGRSQSPQAQGVALIQSANGPCSATMITNDIALTTESCGLPGSTVSLAGTTTKIRNARVPRRSSGNDALIEAIQLQKPLPLINRNVVSTTGFTRKIDTTPLVQGERITCFGYTSGTLRSGFFDVIDGSTDKLYKLRGVHDIAVGDRPKVTSHDLGGFCARDGGAIAAILTAETGLGDVAQAIPLHDLVGGIADVENAARASQNGVAVRFRDDEQQRFLTAVADTDKVSALAPSADRGQRDQAFYLDKVVNPFAGGDWFRLVDARSGRCLAVVPNAWTVAQRSCNATAEQMFFLQYKEVNGAGRYIILGRGGRMDADGNPVPMRSDDGTGSQRFEMWLTQL